MLIQDPHKAADAILSKFKPAEGDEPRPEVSADGDSDDSAGMDSAASEMIAAFKDGDSKALVTALKNFMAMYDAD